MYLSLGTYSELVTSFEESDFAQYRADFKAVSIVPCRKETWELDLPLRFTVECVDVKNRPFYNRCIRHRTRSMAWVQIWKSKLFLSTAVSKVISYFMPCVYFKDGKTNNIVLFLFMKYCNNCDLLPLSIIEMCSNWQAAGHNSLSCLIWLKKLLKCIKCFLKIRAALHVGLLWLV